ncbi:MAG: hypothetical protein RR524_04195 [Erysipelotrichaceae bacterium]
MKKYFYVFLALWFVLLSVNVTGKSENKINYVLYNDSQSNHCYHVKNEINSIYQELMEGVDESSSRMMIVDNKEAFQVIDHLTSRWKNGKLIFKVGDGKGTSIRGVLKVEKICFEKVKPKSLLAELFN